MNDNTPRYPDYATQSAGEAARLKKMAPHDRRVAVDRIRQGLLAQIPAVSMLATLQAWPPPDGDDPGAAWLAQNIRDYHAGHRPGTGNGTGRPAGNGHDSELAALVMRMVMRGCDDEEIETEWWKLAEPPRDPSWPYSHADLRRHIDGARRKYEQEKAHDESWFGLTPAATVRDSITAVRDSITAVPDSQIPGARRFTRVKASSRTAKPVPWLWEPYLVLGALNLLAGYEGEGKSIVAAWIVAQVTRGGWGRPPATVLVVATEDDWDTTIQPRLIAAGADLDLVEQLVPPEGAAELTFPDDCQALEQEIAESGASLVVLDPLLSRVAERFDTHKDAEVRQALEPLKRVLERTECAALGLMHWSKNTTAHNPLDRLMGSRAFSAVTRSTLAVAPHPGDPAAKVLAHGKTNVGVRGTAMTFEIESWADPANPRITAGVVSFLGKLEEFSLSAAFEVKREGKPDAVTVAAGFVRDMLESHGGAVRTSDMFQSAAAEGIAVRTLTTAAVKVLANAEVRQIPGEKHAFAWCQAGLEPPVMMESLARAGGLFLLSGRTDVTGSNEKTPVASLPVQSVLPAREKRPPAREALPANPDIREASYPVTLTPEQMALFDQLTKEAS